MPSAMSSSNGDADTMESDADALSALAAEPLEGVMFEDTTTRRLSEKLEGHALFQNSAHSFIEKLVGTMQPRMYKPGDCIVTYGEVGRAMFFIYKGTVQVIGNDDETVWAELGEDKFFGEIGVLFSVPRTATVRAITRCLTFVLTKDKLEETLKNFPDIELQIQREAEERFEMYRKHKKLTEDQQNVNFAKSYEAGLLRSNLERVPLFRNCEIGFLHMLAMQLTPRTFRPHEYIVRKGDSGDFMCFILGGHVEVVDDDTGTIFATLTEGHFFWRDCGHVECATNRIRARRRCRRGVCSWKRVSREGSSAVPGDAGARGARVPTAIQRICAHARARACCGGHRQRRGRW
eukprot:Opistho-2@85301